MARVNYIRCDICGRTINKNTFDSKNIIRIILYIFWFILLLSNIYTILRKNKNIDDILFIMVLEIGLILSHLLVEVSPRYFIPSTVPIMIIAAFNIYNTKWDKKDYNK